ncbi:MAG: hypothetical protein AB7W59_05125 [Acidimicrobiia bacterium]
MAALEQDRVDDSIVDDHQIGERAELIAGQIEDPRTSWIEWGRPSHTRQRGRP